MFYSFCHCSTLCNLCNLMLKNSIFAITKRSKSRHMITKTKDFLICPASCYAEVVKYELLNTGSASNKDIYFPRWIINSVSHWRRPRRRTARGGRMEGEKERGGERKRDERKDVQGERMRWWNERKKKQCHGVVCELSRREVCKHHPDVQIEKDAAPVV